MKCNIYGRFNGEELHVPSVEIEYADTGNPDSITITLKRGTKLPPALVIGLVENFADMSIDLWHKYGKDEERAINILMPKANYWIEIRG